jgi:hypothetical protein
MTTTPEGVSLKLAPFETWFGEIADEIETVQGLMAERISDVPTKLTEQLSQIEAWQSRFTTLLAEANSQLDRSKYQKLMKKDQGTTDLDRQTRLDYDVMNECRIRDIIKGLSESITNRLMYGMSTRKQSAGETSHHAS